MTDCSKADALRKAADVVSRVEGLDPKPYIGSVQIMFCANDMKEFKTICRAMGTFKKKVDDSYFYAIADCGGEVMVQAFIARKELCQRVLLRVEDVPEQIIPAKPEERIPAGKREVYGWDCAPSLMGPDDQTPGPEWQETVMQEVSTLPDRMDASAGEPAPVPATIPDDDLPF